MTEVWSYLARDPLLWLSMTVAAYAFGLVIFNRLGRQPLFNPSLIAMGVLALILLATGTTFETYFEGAQFVHFLLGPATVCLALPLYDNLSRVRRAALPILAALIAGSLTAIATALGIASAFGVSPTILAALAPKSATAAVALGIAEQSGGSPTLAALMVFMTGLCGAAFATPVLNLLRIRDWRARGFATGVAAHGFGTARAFNVNPTAGAFAGLGMGLNAMMTAILAPLILRMFL
ncbi:LrgB family protein [Xinfangfangia sp. D13-10-4-6]|uniref:LrgB family protein n=1 Tax=Pseudogemmobacter hezensis TaxID=2737662 RepID=UPI0015565073|nr:LrgB family protein [Pseudogemmobacter hezensis]NPD14534.1 LrgB family protein [Pseudogemmobacter hezensis]